MFAYLTHVSDGKPLEMFARSQVRRRLTECERAKRRWFDQELERRAQATERRFGIDMVPESDEYRCFRRLKWRPV